MKRQVTLLWSLAMTWGLLGGAGLAQAQEEAVAVPVATPLVEESGIATPDSAGVFPSLVHQGEVASFLKLLSAATERNIIPSGKVRGSVSVNLYDVSFMEALDAVLVTNGFAYEEKGSFIFVYTAQELAELRESARRTETRVFHLNYVPAADVEALIGPLLSAGSETTTSPAVASGAGGEVTGSGEDWAGSNVLVVVDYPEVLEQVAELISELDHRPAMVLVEATILVADLDDTNELGIDFRFLGGVDFVDAEIGRSTLIDPVSGTATDIGSSSDGLKIGIFQNSMEIMIDALETITDVVTLGNPKIMTLNRQQALVHVGNRDGYVTTTVSQTTATETIEFLETGTRLRFRPFVGDDGYIRMELETEDSSGGVVVEGPFTLPTKTTAEVISNVLVKDGHTIVIGGLFREKVSLTRSQVPFLGNIPLIGPLFGGRTTDSSTKEEVIFLITPHIVEEASDYAAAQKVLEDADSMMLGIREGMLWYGRDRLASSNYQQAREHQAAGRLGQALWHATLATSCSPAFLDAVQLRGDLLGQRLYEEEYGSMKLFLRKLVENSVGVHDDVYRVNEVSDVWSDSVEPPTANWSSQAGATPFDETIDIALESMVVTEPWSATASDKSNWESGSPARQAWESETPDNASGAPSGQVWQESETEEVWELSDTESSVE